MYRFKESNSMRRSFLMGPIDQALCLFSEVKRSVYKSSGGKCPEDYLYIMPIGGIGELILTCSQTHHLRNRPVCLLLPASRFWAVNLWPEAADVFIQLDPIQVELLKHLEDNSFLMPGHIYISYVTWLAGGHLADKLIMREKLFGFREAFAFGLGLPLNSETAKPRLLNKPIPWKPSPNSVLIMPNANFTRKMPEEFWMQLITDLLSQGREVFCENFGSSPFRHPGVVNVQTEVLDFISLASLCGNVIMLRSGLSDLISAHSSQIPSLNLLILWHLDASTVGTPLELWHSPGCSVGFPSSKSWFNCGNNVTDIEIDPLDESWRVAPGTKIQPYLNKL